MADAKEYLTKEKFDELTKELDYLIHEKRRDIARDLEYAKALGDLSENAEYHQARELQATVEERIAKLEHLLKNVEIIKIHHTETVGIGSIVSVKKEGARESQKFSVVGSEEADTLAGKISFASPLGAAMFGKKKGDSFIVNTPKGPVTYKVVGIE
jgi:transcription elongation factor GreA